MAKTTTRRNAHGKLAHDTRGAVMFAGIFAALFLTGALWFLIGIGDAIVFRESAQEATDAAVFSAAAVNAKGMNIIAFLNCLMLAIVFVYLVLALIVDVILFVTGLAIAGVYTAVAVPALVAAAQNVDEVANAYKQGMSAALPVLAGVQTGVAYLAPWGASIAGASVAQKYGFFTVAVGPSNLPGTDASVRALIDRLSGGLVSKVMPKGSGSMAALDGATKKLGLPVKTLKMNYLCKVAAAWVLDRLFALLSGIPLVGRFLGAIRTFVSAIAGAAVTGVHCREGGSGEAFDPHDLYDKKPGRGVSTAALAAVGSLSGVAFSVYAAEEWWSDERGGPKALFSDGVRNGSEWNQVWGWTPATYDDAEGRKVRVATYHGGAFAGALRPAGGDHGLLYSAQAELYYDCDGTWTSAACNGDDVYDYTMYSLRWRSRIVRYRGFGLASFATLFGDFVGEALTSFRMLNWFKQKLGLGKLVGDKLDRNLPPLLRGLVVSRGKNNLEDLFSIATKKVVQKSKGALKPARQGASALH